MGAESNGVHNERTVRQDPAHWQNGTSSLLRNGTAAPRLAVLEAPSSEIQAPDFEPPWTWYAAVKRATDLAGAALLSLLALPLIGLAGLLVVLTSPGPLLYSQVRVGRKGQRFTIWKLRTMTHNCEHDSGPRWATALDTRITPVGRVLRRWHLDELPQLWNVLCGDMSLVGPRPERPEFVPLLAGAIPDYKERHAVQPGMTGLAQVQLPPDTDVDNVRRKLKYDLYYIRHFSLWLDVRILVSTAYYLVQVPFGRVPPWFRVPDADCVEAPEAAALDGAAWPRAKSIDTQVAPETRVTHAGQRSPR